MEDVLQEEEKVGLELSLISKMAYTNNPIIHLLKPSK
jgi:hypothetical protein